MRLFVWVTSTAVGATAGVTSTGNTALIGADNFSDGGWRGRTENNRSVDQTAGHSAGGHGRRTGGNTGDSSRATNSIRASSHGRSDEAFGNGTGRDQRAQHR